MCVYVHREFTGHYPVGTAAVIVAESKEQALTMLNEILVINELQGDAEMEGLREIQTDVFGVYILRDGNY